MMWAQTNGVRFGAAHPLAGDQSPDPVAVEESGGRVVAAWLDSAASVDWSQWSAGSGFAAPGSFRDGGPRDAVA